METNKIYSLIDTLSPLQCISQSYDFDAIMSTYLSTIDNDLKIISNIRTTLKLSDIENNNLYILEIHNCNNRYPLVVNKYQFNYNTLNITHSHGSIVLNNYNYPLIIHLLESIKNSIYKITQVNIVVTNTNQTTNKKSQIIIPPKRSENNKKITLDDKLFQKRIPDITTNMRPMNCIITEKRCISDNNDNDYDDIDNINDPNELLQKIEELKKLKKSEEQDIDKLKKSLDQDNENFSKFFNELNDERRFWRSDKEKRRSQT